MSQSSPANSDSRRKFLLLSGGTVASAVLGVPAVHTSAAQKETRLGIGIIGCGGIMHHHVKGLVGRNEDVEIPFLCDVDPGQINRIKGHVRQGFRKTPPTITGKYEEVIRNPNVDAVIIATPHHWHAPIALQAMAEGKDVYIEKPISHVHREGQMIVDAARKYRRVVQQGSQMRSSPVTARAGKLLRDGLIGEVRVARAWTAETRKLVLPKPDGRPPEGVDYDRWLGAAPAVKFNPLRFHQTWRMFRDYGNGEIGVDGIHDLDMAAWGLGVDSFPVQVTARGGRMLLLGHASEYPDNMNVSYEFDDGRLLIYENYPFTAYGLHGFDNGNVFYGTKGYMIFSRRGAFSVFLGPKSVPGPREGKLRGQTGYAEHMNDFLLAVRSRNLKTAANPQVAHHSCALVHLGEIAYRTGGRVDFDPKTQAFKGNDEANSLLEKKYRSPYGLKKSG